MIMMEKVISNQFDARMSIQAINDVVNMKITLRSLYQCQTALDCAYESHDTDLIPLLTASRDMLCAKLHRLMIGWE